MPELPNTRHERFAQAKAMGKTHWEAMLFAGSESECLKGWDRQSELSKEQKNQLSKNAHKIHANPLVHGRIQEIHQESSSLALEEFGHGKAWVFEQQREVFERAMCNVPVRKRGRDGGFETELTACGSCGHMNPAGVYQCVDLKAAGRAMEIIGRWMGLEAAAKILDQGGRDPFAHMSADEITDYLIAMIRKLGVDQRMLAELLGVDALPAEASQPERPH